MSSIAKTGQYTYNTSVITPDIERQAKRYLKTVDPVLGNIIDASPKLDWDFGNDYFHDLTESIISQQLSIKASDTIFTRFKKLFKNNRINPEDILRITDDSLRAVGLSYQKISYIKDLAEKTRASGILFEQFEIMTDEEVVEELVKVKGIGKWTAEMFLMFSMGRQDVFSYGDLGIRKGLQKVYSMKKEPTEKQALKISNKWKPYRTIACRYLWKSLEL